MEVVIGEHKKGYRNGAIRDARFGTHSGGIVVAKDGSILVCDPQNKRIRRIRLNDRVDTFCKLKYGPSGIAVNEMNGDVYCVTNEIWKMDKEGNGMERIAGGGAFPTWIEGTETERRQKRLPSNQVGFHSLRGIVLCGNVILVSDYHLNCIFKVLSYVVETVATMMTNGR